MADKNLTALTATTALATTDLLYVSDGGNSRKITAENLIDELLKLAVDTYSPSGASGVDVVLGTADFYRIDYYLKPSTDAVNLEFQVTDDNFATVESTSSYGYFVKRDGTAGSSSSSSDSGTSAQLSGPTGNAANEYVAGSLIIGKAADSGEYTVYNGNGSRINASGQANKDTYGGVYKVTSTVNGIRIAFSSGNCTGKVICRPLN